MGLEKLPAGKYRAMLEIREGRRRKGLTKLLFGNREQIIHYNDTPLGGGTAQKLYQELDKDIK